MNRAGFLFLGVCMLLIALLQGDDFFERAARGAMDYGRLLSGRWTLLFAMMLLTWWCFRVSLW